MTNHHLKDLIEVEDTLEAYIDFNGVHASFYATTSYCADVAPLIEIACENMTIRVEDPHVTVYPKDSCALSAFRRNAGPDRQELLGHPDTPHAFQFLSVIARQPALSLKPGNNGAEHPADA